MQNYYYISLHISILNISTANDIIKYIIITISGNVAAIHQAPCQQEHTCIWFVHRVLTVQNAEI